AETQAAWLQKEWRIDFRPRLTELLARDPTPHRTRRITSRRGTDLFVIGCGAWRAVFAVNELVVIVRSLEPGYPERFLDDPAKAEGLPDREAQLAFLQQWPEVSR
ncbi:MAG: hypothetical protein ABI273_01790, partial [Lacunisphaera sp.]